MLFGRADEELRALEEAGIEVEVVPGITTAVAAAAATKQPLTKRGVARSVAFFTSSTAPGPAGPCRHCRTPTPWCSTWAAAKPPPPPSACWRRAAAPDTAGGRGRKLQPADQRILRLTLADLAHGLEAGARPGAGDDRRSLATARAPARRLRTPNEHAALSASVTARAIVGVEPAPAAPGPRRWWRRRSRSRARARRRGARRCARRIRAGASAASSRRITDNSSHKPASMRRKLPSRSADQRRTTGPSRAPLSGGRPSRRCARACARARVQVPSSTAAPQRNSTRARGSQTGLAQRRARRAPNARAPAPNKRLNGEEGRMTGQCPRMPLALSKAWVGLIA